MKLVRIGLLLIISASSGFMEAQSKTQPMLLVKNALIFTMAPETKDLAYRAPTSGYLAVGSDGRLLTVAVGVPPSTLHAREVYDAGGQWVLPGFLSAHSHLWQSAFRGLAPESTLTNWLTAVYNNSAVKAQPADF